MLARRRPAGSSTAVHALAAADHVIMERLARSRSVTGGDLVDNVAMFARRHRQRAAVCQRLPSGQVQPFTSRR
jgi:hypothetical protein